MEANNYIIRHMFEYYLYDYLIRKNMHQTAEMFRAETNLQLDTNDPPTIDVPEGFLLEWWSMNYDREYFRQRLHTNEIQWPNFFQVGNATCQEGQSSMNAEPMNGFPENLTPGLVVKRNSVPFCEEEIGEVPLLYFPSSYIEVCGGMSQLLLPSQHQGLPSLQKEEMLRPVNVVYAVDQNMETFDENTVSDEEMDPVIENLLKSFWKFEPDDMEFFENSIVGEGSRNMNEVADHNSGASSRDDDQSPTIRPLDSNQAG